MLIYKLGFLQTLALKKEENNKLIKLHKKKNFLQKKILHLISNKTLNNVNYITQKPINIGVPTIQLINYNKFYIKNFQKEKNYLKIKYEKERDQFKNKKKLIRLENE
jgi:16S rRNA U1498 N3-methylase RsmE